MNNIGQLVYCLSSTFGRMMDIGGYVQKIDLQKLLNNNLNTLYESLKRINFMLYKNIYTYKIYVGTYIKIYQTLISYTKILYFILLLIKLHLEYLQIN